MAEEVDPIASNFNNLFSSNLFKENNFIKLYNILLNNNTTTSTITINDSTSIITINYTVGTENKSVNIDYTKFVEYSIVDIKSYFNDKVKKKEILESILNKDILKDLSVNDIIVDPAGLQFLNGTANFFKAGELSRQLYSNIVRNNDKTSKTINSVKTHYDTLKGNEDKLFNKEETFRNAIYAEYYTDNFNHNFNHNFRLIHAIGPNYAEKNEFTLNDEIPKFLKLYKDIYNEYEEPIKKLKGNYNLRLPCHSTGLFAGKYKYEILICIAFAYLDIYVKFKNNIPDTTKKINIYYLSKDENITFLKDIIEKLIDVISNKKS